MKKSVKLFAEWGSFFLLSSCGSVPVLPEKPVVEMCVYFIAGPVVCNEVDGTQILKPLDQMNGSVMLSPESAKIYFDYVKKLETAR